MADESRNENFQKLTELMQDARICMLTTMTSDGKHVSRPMGLQEAEFDGNLWFFTKTDSNKVGQIQVNSDVNVAFSDQKHNAWVSISGNAEIVQDKAKMEELWNPLLKAWFPDELETPGITLLKVNAQSAEYWDSPGGAVVSLFGMVKAAVTGKPAEGGENKSIDL